MSTIDRRDGARVRGVDLSPVRVAIADALCAADGLVATWEVSRRPLVAAVTALNGRVEEQRNDSLLLRWRLVRAGGGFELVLTVERARDDERRETEVLAEVRRVLLDESAVTVLKGGRAIAVDASPTLVANWEKTEDGMKLLYAKTDALATLGVAGGRYEVG